MQPIQLTYKEFEKTFSYKFPELNIDLEKSKDGDSGESLIIINSLNDLSKISYAIRETSYKDGYDDADYYHIVQLSSASVWFLWSITYVEPQGKTAIL